MRSTCSNFMGKTLAHVVAGVGVTAASTQVPALQSLSPLLQILLPLVVSFASLFFLMGMRAGGGLSNTEPPGRGRAEEA